MVSISTTCIKSYNIEHADTQIRSQGFKETYGVECMQKSSVFNKVFYEIMLLVSLVFATNNDTNLLSNGGWEKEPGFLLCKQTVA